MLQTQVLPNPLAKTWQLLGRGGLGVALGFALAAALLLSPLFISSFVSLLGRTVTIAVALWLVFVGVQRIPEQRFPRWFPRWAAVLASMIVAAPLATFAATLFGVRGDLSELMQSEPRLRGLVLLGGCALVLGMVTALSAQVRQREAEARAQALKFELERQRLERQAVDAQLSLLQAQVQPHFLFNTLANVQALVETGSPRAAPVLQSLIDYLRAAVPRIDQRSSTLGDELGMVQAYLELMQMRMPDRLAFSVEVEPALRTAAFPASALLTLVENAVRHGVDPLEVGGRIDVRGWLEPATGLMRVTVADNGVGLDPHAAPGTGLSNLRARLAALYGPAARLELSENAPRGVRAELLLPTTGGAA